MRIQGAGMGVTTLKLLAPQASKHRYAVGLDATGPGLDGFEASDFTIHANFGAASVFNGGGMGILVHGKHVFLRRIKVTDFGTTAAALSVITAAGANSENCVIENCVVESPSANNTGNVVFFAFAGTTGNPHRFCTVRNCAGRGHHTFEPPPSVSTKFRSINPGLGTGTIIEGNQIANCYIGLVGSGATNDLVIWNNVWRNVWKGISFDSGSATTGRIVAQDNIVELSRALANPVGLEILGTTGGNRFEDVILRKNLVRQVPDSVNSLRSDAKGLIIKQSARLIAENNVINDMDETVVKPIEFTNCGSVKFFNNQNASGKLLRGYDTAAAKSVSELADEVQDVLLPL
jgi:hypothetical protein